MKYTDLAVISIKDIEDKIKELKKDDDFRQASWLPRTSEQELKTLEFILSNSKPITPLIEEAYFEGECWGIGTDACIPKKEFLNRDNVEI